ncbi:MAG: type II toxin-antitoxin system VapC family toxin [Thermoproteota archaeon]
MREPIREELKRAAAARVENKLGRGVRFVDANVFICVLVKSPKEDYLASKSILKRVEEGEVITSISIIQKAIEWLEYDNRREEVKLLIALNSYAAMKRVETSWTEMLDAVSDMEKYDLDSVNALTLQVMKKNNVAEIYTDDKDFDRVEWIRRVWK